MSIDFKSTDIVLPPTGHRLWPDCLDQHPLHLPHSVTCHRVHGLDIVVVSNADGPLRLWDPERLGQPIYFEQKGLYPLSSGSRFGIASSLSRQRDPLCRICKGDGTSYGGCGHCKPPTQDGFEFLVIGKLGSQEWVRSAGESEEIALGIAASLMTKRSAALGISYVVRRIES